jgi:hypothetical protein
VSIASLGISVLPLDNFVLVRKCRKDHIRDESGKILLHRTDYGLDFSKWMEIRAVGPRCKVIRPDMVGRKVTVPEFRDQMHAIHEEDGWWMMREPILCEKGLITTEGVTTT